MPMPSAPDNNNNILQVCIRVRQQLNKEKPITKKEDKDALRNDGVRLLAAVTAGNYHPTDQQQFFSLAKGVFCDVLKEHPFSLVEAAIQLAKQNKENNNDYVELAFTGLEAYCDERYPLDNQSNVAEAFLNYMRAYTGIWTAEHKQLCKYFTAFLLLHNISLSIAYMHLRCTKNLAMTSLSDATRYLEAVKGCCETSNAPLSQEAIDLLGALQLHALTLAYLKAIGETADAQAFRLSVFDKRGDSPAAADTLLPPPTTGTGNSESPTVSSQGPGFFNNGEHPAKRRAVAATTPTAESTVAQYLLPQ